MPTPPTKPFGRSLSDFGELLPAEKLLRDAVRVGKTAVIAKERPSERTPDNEIRAGFLRFLALGGDEQSPVHERGVQVAGAWISGTLDVTACDIPGNFGVRYSRFDTAPVLLDAHFHGLLNLQGSELPGLSADRVIIDGGLFLREKFSSTGAVRLLGAHIKGSLVCSNSSFNNADGNALSADQANIEGNVFLNDGFMAQGAVRLLGAQIRGDLHCDNGSFKYEKRHAFVAEKMSVTGRFAFKELRGTVSGVNLAGAEVGSLVDDTASWGNSLVLDGFVYHSFAGNTLCDADTRIAWLRKQRGEHCDTPNGFKPKSWKQLFWQLIPTLRKLKIHYQQRQLVHTLLRVRKLRKLRQMRNSFKPQPWKQLIRTLRKMGHEEAARQVAIAYETHRRQHKIIRSWVSRCFHCLFGVFIAYGYRPLHLFYWMLGVWVFCASIYWTAALHDVFAPSNPLVFNHSNYAACRPGHLPGPMQPDVAHTYGNWYLCPQLAGEYTGFSPFAYSLDLILPLVDLQQEHDWAPYIPTPKATWHEELRQFLHPTDWKYHWTRLLVWFEILFGWVASLLLVAVVSGLTNRDKDD